MTIEIMGIKVPVSKKVLTAPNTPIVRAYIDALKAAK
mgnify:CR=1 FL=1